MRGRTYIGTEETGVGVSVELEKAKFDVGEFLEREREKDLLRFSTAGSVDDGKSTLIGRLLYDTQSVYEDQVRSIQGKGTTAPGQIDFALLTDGLRAERE
ncbi:MAG: GTP-binding protein, partial [Terracidiphilus sp.]